MTSKHRKQTTGVVYRSHAIIRLILPSIITSYRVLTLPQLIYSINHAQPFAMWSLFLFAISTDLLDGYIARKLHVASLFGMYLDVISDFLFIFSLYLNFITKGMYPVWILFAILFCFGQFIVTNVLIKQIIYDPIGKHYGTFLFGGIGVTMLFPHPTNYSLETIGIGITTITSIVSRIYYFWSLRAE